jgi:hypothetical protein
MLGHSGAVEWCGFPQPLLAAAAALIFNNFDVDVIRFGDLMFDGCGLPQFMKLNTVCDPGDWISN